MIRGIDQPLIAEPGLRGLLCGTDSRARLLVTGDHAFDALARLLPTVRAGMISVCAAASRCTHLVRADSAWKPSPATAMSCRDLQTVPLARLPLDLTVRNVHRRVDDPAGVALADAVATVMQSTPSIEGPPEVFARYLRSLPRSFRLFAAVDGGAAVRATSGCGAFGSYATVIFVNTLPSWRGRGIGYAMTAQALRAARGFGATQACLDSSDAGLSIYRRLGFETVSPVTRFSRAS
jgi:GNAT superfamily N-acetyltransferase